ncbi:hypothetical protein HN51_005539 [Arachis hypogaea]|uniref:sucrose transport protein SUC1-like n=1 Tax=Arachis hypogaea TaxID=3818 RepID=UPI000DEC5D8E|nr:sucrose transport protein SUC5-like [Arachis hypogaea]QHO39316.1 Sucrose transport protein [Arachis hypogaea]
MLTRAVTGLMSLAVEPIGRALGGAKNLWAAENFILVGGLAMMLYITKLVKDERLECNDLTFTREPSNGIRAWVLHFFSVLVIPLAITLSVASALASIYSNENRAGKVRNELGYFAVFFRRFDDMLSFTVTKACHGLCVNVKTLSIFSILLLLFLMVVALSCVQNNLTLNEEESREREEEDDRWAVVALFSFFWYISDWMGSEVHSGEHGKLYSVAIPLYTIGYWYGARCLMLTWAVTGLMSLAVEPIGLTLGGTKNLWTAGNFILNGGFPMTLYISKLAKDERLKRNNLTFTREPSNGIQAWILCFFDVLGIFLTITLSVAPALPSIYSNESGAGKVRNELGYFAIFFRRFDDMLSFTMTKACHGLCTNVKTLSIFLILLLLFLMAVALSCVQDKPALPEQESREREEEDDRWAVVKCF